MAKTKDAYYFSHDSNAKYDEKILLLRADYGYEGYGLYWAIVECMREINGYKINLDTLNVLSIALNYDTDKLKVFVDDCVKKYKLFYVKDNKFYSNRLLRSMQKRMQLHNKMKANALERWNKSNALKEKKGKEREGKETYGIIPPSLSDVLLRCDEMNYADKKNEAQKFMNHYNSNGWMVGKNKMIDWDSALAGWFSKTKEFTNGKTSEEYIDLEPEKF